MGVFKRIRDGLGYPVRAIRAQFKPHRPDVNVLRAAIAYAVEYPEGRSEGIEWLAAWQEGEPEAMAELDRQFSRLQQGLPPRRFRRRPLEVPLPPSVNA